MASESLIFVKTFDFLKWIISRTEKFPKSQRFFLAGRINNAMFDFYEVITEAVTVKGRSVANKLYIADARLYNARHYIRLTKERDIETFLEDYRLKLKPGGVTLYPTQHGFPFLGYRLLPYAVLVKREIILRLTRRITKKWKLLDCSLIELDSILASFFATIGHFMQADSCNLQCKLFFKLRF